MKRSLFPIALALLSSSPGCNSDLMDDEYGSIEVTASAPTAQNAFPTSDGWSIDLDKMVVHVTAMNVTGSDQVLTASAADVFVDLTKAAPQTLLSATARKARFWELFDFEIGPAAIGEVEPTIVGDASADDVQRMQKDGFSILVEGSATRGAEKKTFSWTLTTDTLFSECEGGLVVPPNGVQPVDIGFRADVLFADDPAAPDVFRFQPFADADADANGAVTLEELAAASTNLATALDEGSRRIVGSYRGSAKCKAAAAPAPTE